MTKKEPRSNGPSTGRRTFLKSTAAGGVVTATGLAGCLSSLTGGGEEVYEIGLVNPYTGDLAPFGDRNDRGSELALQSINEETVNGNTMEVLSEDSQTSPDAGVSATQKLVNQDGVEVITGACSSGVSMAMAESVCIPNEILHMNINSTSPAISDLDDDDYVLRTSVSDAFQGRALARVLMDNDVQQTSVIMVNNDYGRGLAEAFQGAYENDGGTVETLVPAESGRSSYEPQLNEAMDPDPEALTFIVYPESFQTMIRQAYEMGVHDDAEIFAAESIVSDEVEQNVDQEAINGMKGTNPSPPVESDIYQNFADEFQAEYDRTPTVWASYTYDAYMLIALALQKAGEYDSTALRDVIYDLARPPGTEVSSFAEGKSELEDGNEINYEGVSGSVDLNEDGDPPGTYQHWEVIDGTFEMQGFMEVGD